MRTHTHTHTHTHARTHTHSTLIVYKRQFSKIKRFFLWAQFFEGRYPSCCKDSSLMFHHSIITTKMTSCFVHVTWPIHFAAVKQQLPSSRTLAHTSVNGGRELTRRSVVQFQTCSKCKKRNKEHTSLWNWNAKQATHTDRFGGTAVLAARHAN